MNKFFNIKLNDKINYILLKIFKNDLITKEFYVNI